MFTTILGVLTGLAGPISNIVSKISDLQTAKLQASTNIEKAKIDQQIEELHDKRAVLIAEAGSRLSSAMNATVRAVAAAGPIAYVAKIFLWDKVIGSFVGCSASQEHFNVCTTFSTDPIDPMLWAVVTAVLGFYFVTSWVNRK